MCVYLRTKFQVSNITLSFRQVAILTTPSPHDTKNLGLISKVCCYTMTLAIGLKKVNVSKFTSTLKN